MRSRWFKLFVWLGGTLPLLLAVRLLFNEGLGYSIFTVYEHENVENMDQTISSTRAFTAGKYMVNRYPENISYCTWQYDLPQQLSYGQDNIILSPELGRKGSYRVLPSVIRNNGFGKSLPKLTLCTHATADQVYAIVELAKRWEGPISLAIFAPGIDATLTVSLLHRACCCEPTMIKVSVHFIFPVTVPPKLNQQVESKGDCLALDLYWKNVNTERKSKAMTYPINVARNIARMQADTLRVLVSDIELLPSEGLASGFLKMVRGKPPKIGVVFVVPVFEIEASEDPPKTKQELLAASKAGVAFYFHRFLCPHCQRFPGLTRWMLQPDKGKVTPLLITRREVPHHRWEPVFIGTKEDPLYTEEMSWEGRQDKMTQMFEMCLLNYRLVVLDGAFLVHTPGIKRKSSNYLSERSEVMRLYERRNSKIYQSVVRRMLKLHPTNRKCRQ